MINNKVPVLMFTLCSLFFWAITGCHSGSQSSGEGNATNTSKQPLQYKVVLDTIMSLNNDTLSWFEPRAGVIPGDSATVVMTLQKFLIGHSDVFLPLESMYSRDYGKTWSLPRDKGDAFFYKKARDGVYIGQCDFTPKWNRATQTLLATGHTVHYKNEHLIRGLGRATVYSTYNPSTHEWTKWSTLKMPNDPAFYNSGAGATQRVDLPNGDILLPVYCKSKDAERYSSTVLKCFFDGETLTYKSHGDFLTIDIGRGLYEPSLTVYNDTYYLTMRNDSTGYCATSKDGLHFTTPKIWHFDNGQEVGTWNTQQHWVTHSSGLFLVYTRKAAHNQDIIRNRAPLFMAQVDTSRMVLLKNTERIIVPNRGAPLGNFGVANINKNETWVTVAETMSKYAIKEKGAIGNVYAARIIWGQSNMNGLTKY